MATDKKINYEMQGGSKPARNYLRQTKNGIPGLLRNGSLDQIILHTELAYITKAEKDLLIKKDLHNSLKRWS